MNKKSRSLSLLLLLLCSSGGAAQAGTLNVLSLPASVAGQNVGYATATLDGQPVSVWSDDFLHPVALGSASMSVASLPVLSGTRFATTPGLDAYERVGMLLYEANFGINPVMAFIQLDIQLAVWQIMDPGDVAIPTTNGSTSWLFWAGTQDAAQWHYSGMAVLTPSAGSLPELIVGSALPGPPSAQDVQLQLAAPEPGTSLLFLGGLAMIVIGYRRV